MSLALSAVAYSTTSLAKPVVPSVPTFPSLQGKSDRFLESPVTNINIKWEQWEQWEQACGATAFCVPTSALQSGNNIEWEHYSVVTESNQPSRWTFVP